MSDNAMIQRADKNPSRRAGKDAKKSPDGKWKTFPQTNNLIQYGLRLGKITFNHIIASSISWHHLGLSSRIVHPDREVIAGDVVSTLVKYNPRFLVVGPLIAYSWLTVFVEVTPAFRGCL